MNFSLDITFFKWKKKGQNYLTELKDKISCVKSEIKVGEFSENMDEIKAAPKLGVNAHFILTWLTWVTSHFICYFKEVIESGYFFIENILFNDLRSGKPDCSA